MAATQRPDAETRGSWVRGHVLTRLAATVWWVAVLAISALLAVSLVGLAVEPDLGHLISTAIVGVIFVPIAREWPNWRRMGRMLRHGT